MSLSSFLLELLLKGSQQSSSWKVVFAGYSLVTVGMALGGYFLFTFLAQRVGYFETGFGLSLLVGGGGLLLIQRGRKKQAALANSPLVIASKIIQEIDFSKSYFSKSLSKYGSKVIPLLLLAGFLISQFKGSSKRS